ncbi:MAG: ATP-binding protein [Mediterranea sp.]|jgi:predicted ATP-binding protein involved in virulence|nr:ATP-binding protein [Mediterranea sp.]
MSNFITSIDVKQVFHLKDFTIPISDTEKKHLIITGKNGSGKTVLMNAIVDCLNQVFQNRPINKVSQNVPAKTANSIAQFDDNGKKLFTNSIDLNLSDVSNWLRAIRMRTFLLAYYGDERKANFVDVEPFMLTKPQLSWSKDIQDKKVDQFLSFMVYCKVQAAMNGKEEADAYNHWFDEFEEMLRQIYGDKELTLEFQPRDYSFFIHTEGKDFKLTQLSAGYSSILDIVTDLILKMQSDEKLVRAYEMEGIVLIDEIDAHLHLELQRLILPMLTKFFPNIQFIVTTHSPFILNSLPNAVVFDMERREAIQNENLTNYSYEALTEGYFGIQTASSDLMSRLGRIEELIHSNHLSKSESAALDKYFKDFDKIPDAVVPNIKARYKQLKVEWLTKAKA